MLQAGKANGFSTREDISKQHTLVRSEVLPGLTAFEHVKRIVLVVENQSLVDRFLNLHVAAHREIHDSAGDITRVNGVIDQGTGFCGRNLLGGLVHGRDGLAGIGITAFVPPESKQHGEGHQGKEQDWIAADKPSKTREGRGLFQDPLRNVNVNGQTAAHGERIGCFENSVRALDLGSSFMSRRSIGTGKGLCAQRAGSIVREVHESAGMIDGNRPVVASHVPVELVVVVEETNAVAHGVVNLDRLGGVHRIGKINLQIAITVERVRLVFQPGSAAVRDAPDIHEQRVVRAAWAGVLKGDGAMNPVPFADEHQGDELADNCSSILVDCDGVLVITDAPALSMQRSRLQQEERQQPGVGETRLPASPTPRTGQIRGWPGFSTALWTAPDITTFTATGSRSAACTSKNWRCWKANIPARMLVGKD